MISFSCAACSKALRVKDELAGKRIKCPACGVATAVPAGQASRTPPAPPPKKAEPRRRAASDDEDERDEETEDEAPRRKKGKKGSAAKPSVFLMLAGVALALGGLVAMSAFIYFGKKAGDLAAEHQQNRAKPHAEWEEFDKVMRRFGADDIPAPDRAKLDRLKKAVDDQDAKIQLQQATRSRHHLMAGVFGSIFLVGVAIRGYHHLAMNRWHREQHGLGKSKKRRDDDDDG